MTTKPKESSRILDAVHETARDLREAGAISERQMQGYDALCLRFPGRFVPSRLDLTELGLPPEQPLEMSISEALAEPREED